MILSSISLLILGVVFGASLFVKGRSFLGKHHWRIFLALVLVLFSYATYQGFRLYSATRAHQIGQFFDIEYILIFRVGVGIFIPYLISFIVALAFMWIAIKYNRKYGGRFFEKEEIQIGGLSLLLVGHPGWVFYSIALILLYLLLHIAHYILHTNKSFRLSIYHLWVPTAIFVILISEHWLSNMTLWFLLEI